jgi:hypothetical protein
MRLASKTFLIIGGDDEPRMDWSRRDALDGGDESVELASCRGGIHGPHQRGRAQRGAEGAQVAAHKDRAPLPRFTAKEDADGRPYIAVESG